MKNIIFDLDGTLADTAILTMAAFKNVAPRVGLPIPALETVRKAIGYANPEFYDHVYPNEPRELVRRAGKLVEQEELTLLPIMEDDMIFKGCRELLQSLKDQGVELFIASTGSDEHVSSVVDRADIRHFFRKIFCGKSDKISMLREIIGGHDKGEFLMVGDMGKDCEGAHANGICAVGACYGYCVRGASSFDKYIDEPLELLEILKGDR